MFSSVLSSVLRRILRRSSRYISKFGDSHVVLNQSHQLVGYNAFMADLTANRCISEFKADWAKTILESHGSKIGSEEYVKHGELANKNLPYFKSHDKFGNRINSVDYHPSYHELMKLGIESGASSYAWNSSKAGSHILRAALMYLHSHIDAGTQCPMVMSFASYPALLQGKAHMSPWIDKLIQLSYDNRDIPMQSKTGITIGMSMTEKQGGSDIRANTTTASLLSSSLYQLTGHKWFTSAPMCDAFLTLAKIDGDTKSSCFLVPRWHEDHRNAGFRVQRLKSKLGDQSNASSEVEYHDAFGTLIGKRGDGLNVIMSMVQLTRFECVIGSSGGMSASLFQVLHHISHRSAFGSLLSQKPLMKRVVCDLLVETSASVMSAFRLGNLLEVEGVVGNDAAAQDSLFRISSALLKYYVCKRQVGVVHESMECLGGNGFVEDFPLCRLYRQAPLNSIWEGSGNIIALDVVTRCIGLIVSKLMPDIELACGKNETFDLYVKQLKKILTSPISFEEGNARYLADALAVGLQASQLLRFGDSKISNYFVSSRLGSKLSPSMQYGWNYGSGICDGKLCDEIVEEHVEALKRSVTR